MVFKPEQLGRAGQKDYASDLGRVATPTSLQTEGILGAYGPPVKKLMQVAENEKGSVHPLEEELLRFLLGPDELTTEQKNQATIDALRAGGLLKKN